MTSSSSSTAALAIAWDPHWRTPLPLGDAQWPIGSPKKAALLWIKEGAPTDRLTGAVPSSSSSSLFPHLPSFHRPQVCSLMLNLCRADGPAQSDRMANTVFYRAEWAARWAPATTFFKWFDQGIAELSRADQQRLVMRCLLGAFDTDHRPVFSGLWQRWHTLVQADGLSWEVFLRQAFGGSAHAALNWSGSGFEFGDDQENLEFGTVNLRALRGRSSHPWHLPFVERGLTQAGSAGGALVQRWAQTGECPVSAWAEARMGAHQDLAPVAAMYHPRMARWAWDSVLTHPGLARRHGVDLMEGWLLRSLRDDEQSPIVRSAQQWIDLLEPAVKAGARLPHDRDPNRREIARHLPLHFETPGARTWDPAVSNRQNHVPPVIRDVWARLIPLEQHWDEVDTLRALVDETAPSVPSRPRVRL